MRNLSKKLLFISLIVLSLTLIVFSVAQAVFEAEGGSGNRDGIVYGHQNNNLPSGALPQVDNTPRGNGGFAIPQEPGAVGASGSLPS